MKIASNRGGSEVKRGSRAGSRFWMPWLPKAAQTILNNEISNALSKAKRAKTSFTVTIQEVPQLLFYKRLNPGSLFPPAYEICVYSLVDSIAQQRRLRWQFGGVGALLLLGGFVASHFVPFRFAKPRDPLTLHSTRT